MLNTLSQNTISGRTLFFTLLLLVIMIFTSYPGFASTSFVPITGQTVSYTAGDDGDWEGGVSWPAPRFTDNDDGTVTDNLTNLTWLKKADCLDTLNWTGALAAAETLEDGDCDLTDSSSPLDWRVPNVRELDSLIHAGVSSPSLPNRDGSAKASAGNPFSSLQTGDYWTSTTNTATPSNAFSLSLQWGHVLSNSKTDTFSTLFVRDSGSGSPFAEVFATGQIDCYNGSGDSTACDDTGQDGDLQKGAVWPTPRFSDNGDGTIYDHLSGLTWLKNANCLGLDGWTGAINFANNLASGDCGLSDVSEKGDWRLPNRRELHSLINYNENSPALADTTGDGQWSDKDPFTNVQATSGYWSSTTYDGFTGHAWYVNINNGILGSDGKTKVAYTWPIRQYPMFSIDITLKGDGAGTVTSTPTGLSCPGDCSGSFAKNSAVTLTAQSGENSRFDGWSLKSCGKKHTCVVTMSTDTAITATFLENSATISSWLILLTR